MLRKGLVRARVSTIRAAPLLRTFMNAFSKGVSLEDRVSAATKKLAARGITFVTSWQDTLEQKLLKAQGMLEDGTCRDAQGSAPLASGTPNPPASASLKASNRLTKRKATLPRAITSLPSFIGDPIKEAYARAAAEKDPFRRALLLDEAWKVVQKVERNTSAADFQARAKKESDPMKKAGLLAALRRAVNRKD